VANTGENLSLNSNLFVDTATGNVGIGTADPKTKLHVSHDLHLQASSEAWNSTAGPGLYLRYSTNSGQDSGYIQSIDRTGQTTLKPLSIEASTFNFNGGNVGIGVASPTQKLHVAGNILANNLYINSSRYLGNVSGDYGTVQCNGGGANGWEGYSIDGRVVFMHDGGTAAGIYNDVDNHWLFYGVRGAETRMYHNGAEALRTYSEGIRINSRTYISCTSQTYNTTWTNAPSQGDTGGAYIIVVQGATNDISCAIFACTDDSGFEGGNVAVLQRSTDYANGSAYFDCRWAGNSYIQLRHTVYTRACYVTVFRTV